MTMHVRDIIIVAQLHEFFYQREIKNHMQSLTLCAQEGVHILSSGQVKP